MGCVASRLEEEEEVVGICRERKHQLKLAVERRYTLADAHYRYCQSLYGVSAAIRLFVARHSSLSSPFLITFPPPPSPPTTKENVVSNPLFLQQTPTEPTKETITCKSCESSNEESDDSCSSDEGGETEGKMEKEEEQQPLCEYYYMEMPPPLSMPSPQRDFGWDFFNPFNNVVRPEIISSGYNNRISEEDLRVVREQEGIPDLEEDGERLVEERKVVLAAEEKKVNLEHGSRVESVKEMDNTAGNNPSQTEQKGLTVIDTPVRGRELLEALKDIEDHFIRAYDSGKDVSRMLEVNRVQLQSNLEEIKENSTKIIQAIAWRSTSSRSSSCKSLVASNSKSSSTWTEFRNDLFDDYGGMNSGSHSLTLGRLYAWEKKLYEEVKAGDSTRKMYEKKCNQLRNQDVRGDEGITVEKTRAAVKDLYSRILVAIRSAETISKQIEKLRDEELQPQIIELLQGMMKSWKIMLESHEIQNKIMFEVKTFTCPTYGKFCNDSHRLATLQLQAELQNWRTCFREYIGAQRAYIEALHGWLSKFIVPEVEFYSRSRNSAPPCQVNGPPLLMISRKWLTFMDKLPDKAVSYAIRSCVKDVRALWVQQGEEQQQKRKVDSLSKELERKILAFQKTENRICELKLTDHAENQEIDHKTEFLKERTDLLDNFRRKVDLEKENHQNCIQETERITLNEFQTAFGRVFDTMTEFSRATLIMYTDLLTNNDNIDLLTSNDNAEKDTNTTFIEGSQHEDGKR